MKHLFWISLRMLKGERKGFSPVLIVSLVGVAFGMAAMVVSLSVMTGFERAYEDSILNFNAHIVLSSEDDIGDPAPVMTELARYFVPRGKLSKIVGVTPFVFREGLSLSTNGATSIVIKGVDPKEAESVYPKTFIPTDPNLTTWEEALNVESALGKPVAVVGSGLLKELKGAQEGEALTIRLLVPRETGKGKSLEEMAGDFEITGSFESGLHEFDSQFIVMSLRALQKEFGMGSRVSGFEIRLDDRERASALARELEQNLSPKGTPLGSGSFQAIAWGELNEALFSAMKMEKAIFCLIMFVILLVASFNVVGVLAMQIYHRAAELNILAALGMTRSRLGKLFGFQGLLLAAGGIVLGSLLAVLLLFLIDRIFPVAIDPKIYFISRLPVTWPTSLWVALIAGSLLLCGVVSWLSSLFLLRRHSLIHTFR